MARIRTIKPEFWEDETIGILSHGARLLFLGTLNLCDDEGLLRWNEMYLGSTIFPYDDLKIETIRKWMQELVNNELIFQYKSMKINQTLGLIVSFHKHQRVDKPQPAKFPAPNWRDVRLRHLIGKRDGWKCHVCGGQIVLNDSIKKNGSKALSLDHLKPQSKGGSDFPSNLRACHLSCNHSKSDRYEDEETNSGNDSGNNSENDSYPERKGKERKGKGREVDKEEVSPHIFLLASEVERLKQDYGEYIYSEAIQFLSDYSKEKPDNFKKYKDHNLTIRRWVIDAVKEKKEKSSAKKESSKSENLIDANRKAHEHINALFANGPNSD